MAGVTPRFPSRLFVTGTSTEIGKSVTAAVLMAGIRGRYWKPVQSGLDTMTDTQWVMEKTGLPAAHFYPETYRLKCAMSPHASAAAEGVRIELSAFRMPDLTDHATLVVEGAGGLMVPLNDRHFMLDLIKLLDIPVLLVSSSALGTINHTLLSLEQLRRHDIPIFGVVMNGPKNRSNREAIEHFGNVRVCAEIEPMPEINPHTLRQVFDAGNWNP